MRFEQLKLHDAALAILIAVVAVTAGASYRGVLAQHFAAARLPPAPIAEVKQAAPSPPARPARVITKAPAGANLFDQQRATGKPIAQIKAGAMVLVIVSNQGGWSRVRSQAGTEGWTSADSLETETASASALTLFDSFAQAAGAKVSAPGSGALYASPALTERIGSFARKDKLELLRPGGRVTLVSASDGAGGKIIAYARTTEVRSVAPPRPVAVTPDAGVGDPAPLVDPFAEGTGSPGGERPAADAGEAALKEAQDQYAGGNFQEAQTKAEAAVALGSSGALVIAAMSSCKLGDLDKAMRYGRKLRGAKLIQFRTACPSASPKPADSGSAQPPATPASDGQESP